MYRMVMSLSECMHHGAILARDCWSCPGNIFSSSWLVLRELVCAWDATCELCVATLCQWRLQCADAQRGAKARHCPHHGFYSASRRARLAAGTVDNLPGGERVSVRGVRKVWRWHPRQWSWPSAC